MPQPFIETLALQATPSKNALALYDAFSSREEVTTSLENAFG
jgi:hypothetical protein